MADVFNTVGTGIQSDIRARFDAFDALTMPRNNPLVLQSTPQIPPLAFEKMAREVQSFAGFNMERKVRNAATLAATYDMPLSTALGLHDAFVEKLHEPNLWDKAVGSFKAGWGDVYCTIGGILKRTGIDPEGAGRYLYWGEQLRRAYIPPSDQSELSWRKLLDPEWYATTIMRSVPSHIALIPAALVGVKIGAVAGGALAVKAGLSALGAKTAGVIAGAAGGAALSRPLESAMEAQGAYEEAKKKGFTDEAAERAASQVFWDNMKLTGMDAAELAAAFLPMGKVAGRTAKRIMAQRILAITGKLGAVSAKEAGEERYQEKAVMNALGDPVSFFDFSNPRLNEATAAGAIFGMGLGGAGSVWTALTNRITADMPKRSKQVYEQARTEAVANGAETQAAELAGLDAVASTPEGKAHIETVITDLKDLVEGKPARETAQQTVQPQESAQGQEAGRLGIRRYADGDSVGRISEQTAEEINKLGFSTNASDVKISQKTIHYIDEKSGKTLTADDVDYLRKTIEEPTEVLPNIGKDRAEYRVKSVLMIRRNGKNYVSIVEVSPGEKENVLWNFWKGSIKDADRYLKKFREEKARILESGGRRLPHFPPDQTAGGKPESLSGSQTQETGTENIVPPYKNTVKEGQREGQSEKLLAGDIMDQAGNIRVSPERRQAVIDERFEGKTSAAALGRPADVILTGGPPGAGKSTALNGLDMKPGEYVKADADAIKTKLGYEDQADAVHEESSAISKAVAERALNEDCPLIYDSLLANFSAVDTIIQRTLKKEGAAHIFFTNTDAVTSQVRSRLRYERKETARTIPPEASVEGYNNSLPTFIELWKKYKDNPKVDFALFDNNIDNARAVEVFTKIGGELKIENQSLFDSLMHTPYNEVGGRYERTAKATVEDVRRAEETIRHRVIQGIDRGSKETGHSQSQEVAPPAITFPDHPIRKAVSQLPTQAERSAYPSNEAAKYSRPEGQENTTASINNETAQKGRQAAEITRRSRTFILSPEGSIDFGVVPEAIAEASNGRFPGAPIRVEEGSPDTFGRSHISKERIALFKSLGYRDELDMLHDVAQHFTSIYEQPNGRLLLVKKNGKNKYAVVELQKEAENYYGVTTWFIEREERAGKPYEQRSGRKLLMDVARPEGTLQ